MRLVNGGQLKQRRRHLDVGVGHFFVLFRHAIRSHGRLFEVRIVVGEKLQFVLEKVIHIANGGAQIDLVGGLAEATDQPAEKVELLARFRAQILIVLEKHLQMLVGAEGGMGGQSRQEYLVHGDRFLERG